MPRSPSVSASAKAVKTHQQYLSEARPPRRVELALYAVRMGIIRINERPTRTGAPRTADEVAPGPTGVARRRVTSP